MSESALVEQDGTLTEQARVVLNRYAEAREYGFTRLEARRWAESGEDVSALRRLKAAGCCPRLAAEILL